MTSSPEGAPHPPQPPQVRGGPRDGAIGSTLLRGASAAVAQPWQRVHRPAPPPRAGGPVVPTAQPVGAPAGSTAQPVGAPAGSTAQPVGTPVGTTVRPPVPPPSRPDPVAAGEVGADAYTGEERRAGERRAGDRRLRSTTRLGDVYAEQLEQLRELARQEGWAAGHAEGLTAAADVVAAAERAAEARLAEAQARWERRLATATAALGDAARQLEATAAPLAEELRESVLDAVLTLVGDMLGRELLLAGTPGLDALRRALTLCPDDVPVVVRLHPDDLAEVPREELHALPASVSVVGDPEVERAGAIATAGTTRVDAQLTAALARVRAVLRS